MSDMVSGDQLAELLRGGGGGVGGSAPPRAAAGGGVAAGLAAARRAELRHELVALLDGKLTLNWANFEDFRSRADPDAPTLVVSFLGDTSVGKSTIIRELVAGSRGRACAPARARPPLNVGAAFPPFFSLAGELIGDGAGEERPFVQRSAEQSASTTFNVNMYTSTHVLDRFAVHFLDFEGESGSAEPTMAAGGGAPAPLLQRGGRGGGAFLGVSSGGGGSSSASASAAAFARVARGVADVTAGGVAPPVTW